jgi:pimeloyl-ACP methyl ester carboxylesterase
MRRLLCSLHSPPCRRLPHTRRDEDSLHVDRQMPGTGHFVMMEQPQEFNALLAGFVDKIKY